MMSGVPSDDCPISSTFVVEYFCTVFDRQTTKIRIMRTNEESKRVDVNGQLKDNEPDESCVTMEESANIIKDTLNAGDGFTRLLILFDMIIETDTVGTMQMKDVARVNVVCDHYGFELPDAEKQLLINNLANCRQERRKRILEKTDSIEGREAFITELENHFGL